MISPNLDVAVIGSPAPAVGDIRKLCSHAGTSLQSFTAIQERGAGHILSCLNEALDSALKTGTDLLVFDCPSMPSAEALREMCRVLYADPMILGAAPRSNAHPFCPWPRPLAAGVHLSPALGAAIHRRFDEVVYVPFLASSCVLLKTAFFAEMGFLDTSYSYWENAIDDALTRANRYGFRSILINQAPLTVSVCSCAFSCQEDRKKLLLRYPEMEMIMREFLFSPFHHAETLYQAAFSTVPLILFDFSTFASTHDGTNEAGIRLAEQAASLWKDWRVGAIASKKIWNSHALGRIPNLIRVSPSDRGTVAAAVIRIGQPWKKQSLFRLFDVAPIVAVFMLDAIGYDCSYIHQYAPNLEDLWHFVFAFCDIVFTQSSFTLSQLEKRFSVGSQCTTCVTYHSLDPEEYTRGENTSKKEFFLIVGNALEHKFVMPTVERLAQAFPGKKIVAVGAGECQYTNVRAVQAGVVSDDAFAALYASCICVIFPSLYEGFGFPVLHGLAHHKVVYVRRAPLAEELKTKLGNDPNIRLYSSTDKLIEMLSKDTYVFSPPPTRASNGWAQSAQEVRRAIESQFTTLSFKRVLDRLRICRGLASHL